MSLTGRARRMAFTLIELLVVIGIIAILAGILTPVIQSSFRKGQRVTAQGDVIKIVNGWKSYYNEYGRWPTDARENIATGQAMNAYFVGILTTRYNENLKDNPKNVMFMEVTAEQLASTANLFLDPWGTPYRVLFDTNYNGRIERQTLPVVYDTIIAWSAGPDTNTATDAEIKDDIKSWE
ncbi:MAG: prepilin-type N-terminal cleavage/methylation domain-containing protein [bacterium]